MALITCPECGREVSNQSQICPHCGFPISKYIIREKKKADSELRSQKGSKQDRSPKKKKSKKAKIAIFSVLFFFVLSFVLIYIFVFLRPYNDSLPEYTKAKTEFDSAVEYYNTIKNQIDSANTPLEEKIEDVNVLINSGRTALDDSIVTKAINSVSNAKTYIKTVPEEMTAVQTKHQNVYNVFSVFEMKKEITLLNYDTEVILSKAKALTIPEHSELIHHLDAIQDTLEKSYRKFEQVCNPTEAFVIERIQEVPGITTIEAVTEETDVNGQLHKDGGYTAAIYFIHESVTDWYVTGLGPSAVTRGTDGGGCIEVFNTVEDAQRREAYLSGFDGTVMSSGSHKVIGTVLLRVSNMLTATQQENITGWLEFVLTDLR